MIPATAPALISRRYRRALTLPEMLMVLAILSVLVAVTIGGYRYHISKAESVDTIYKLKNMHTGLSSYLVDKQTWPQEPEDDTEGGDDALWEWWQKEMKPYGIHDHDWYTTAHLRILNRQLKESGGKSVQQNQMGKEEELKFPSILPGNFPPGFNEPFRYRGQPWVSETGEYHGDDGIFTVMPDGTIHKMMTLSQMNSARGNKSPSKK